MTRIMLFLLAALPLASQMLLTGPARKNYTQDPACMGAWRMSSGSLWERDISGHGNTLVAAHSITANATVPAGFTGRSRTLSAAASDQLDGIDGTSLDINGADAKLSIVAWINPTAPANGVLAGVVGKYSSGVSQRQYVLHITGTGSGNYTVTGIVSAAGTTGVSSAVSSSLAGGVWHHVAFTSDDANLRLYIDGTQVGSNVAHTAGIFNGTEPFRVGMASFGGTNRYTGLMDEVAVFNRALSVAEIGEIKTHGIEGVSGSHDTAEAVSYRTYFDTPATILSYADTITAIDALCTANPAWSCTTFGTTAQSRAIRGVIVNGTGYTSTVQIDGAIHGDEKLSARAVLDWLNYLSANPGMYSSVRWVVTPITNPDGYAANTRGNAASVDLNRNFAEGWGGTCTVGGTAPNIGTAGDSELESQAVRGKLTTYSPLYHVSVHGNDNALYVNAAWSQTISTSTNNYLQTNAFPTLLYAKNTNPCGKSTDHSGYAMDYEVGTGAAALEINRFIGAMKALVQ